uniref:Centrosomal protein of 70 kDa n=1 Tax=Chelonoidis abingdonii TaxID=106734 RepID=A0A8C0GJ78_CHEAB
MSTDMIVLDKQSSLGIRLALKTLVDDTERQQKMMHGLIEANRQDDIRQERGRACRQEQRAKELENVVENIKSKICQLEDECIAKVCQQQNQVKELQKVQQASQTKYHHQNEKLHEQEETIARLQKELHKVGMEEQQRVATQNKIFCQFCKRHCVNYLSNKNISLVLKVLSKIDSVISSPRAPLVIYKWSKGPVQNYMKENGQECGFEHLPPTVEMWADQLMSLKDLHRSLRKLSVELVPWHTIDTPNITECVRVEDLQFIVDTILEEVENKEKMPSLQTLYAIVSHFQKLFDVTSLNGVYPRMNEVYTKLGEMTNAMRNLHELLELDHSAPPTVLVNTVGKLCKVINENVTGQVEQLLGTQDIQSIINKLEEHEDFFPVFQALIQDLLCVLGKSVLQNGFSQKFSTFSGRINVLCVYTVMVFVGLNSKVREWGQ